MNTCENLHSQHGPCASWQANLPPDGFNLRDAFDAYLCKLKADGTYDKLIKKYYPDIRNHNSELLTKKE